MIKIHDNTLLKLAKDFKEYNKVNDIFDLVFDPNIDIRQVYAICPDTKIHCCYVKCCDEDNIYLIPTDILLTEGDYLRFAKSDYGILWSIFKKDLL